MNRKVISYILGALLFFILFAARPVQQDQHQDCTPDAHAPEAVSTEEHSGETDPLSSQEREEEGFSPSNFIFDHILDAYEWHILSHNGFHLTIPLPVILIS